MPIECICLECGSKFKVKPYIIKSGRGKFCKKNCWYSWKSKHDVGENNPNYGNKWSDEQKKKFSESRMGENNPFFGGVVSDDHRELLRSIRTDKPLSDITKYKLSVSCSGEKNHNWRGGVSFEPYCPKFTREFRNRVRIFWNYKCGDPECGKTQEDNGAKLSVHHIHFDKNVCCNDKPAMFIPLCRSCHSKTTRNPDKYIRIYEELIMEKFGGKSYYSKEEYLMLIITPPST